MVNPEVTEKIAQQKSKEFRNAKHKWFELIAKALNDAGFSQRMVLEKFKAADVDNTKESQKELFRECERLMFPECESTEDANNAQAVRAIEVYQRAISERFGIYVEFPSNTPPMVGDYIDHSKRQA